jgi:pimeloyl-ACP methyl ester carboxylesterase
MPQDADIATPLQTEMFTLPSGLALRRVVLGPRDAKATVLLLHGYPETVQVWYRLAPLLARDVAVHAFDWPGYGGSTRPRDADFGYRARAYARVLDEYIAAAGIDRAGLLVYGTHIGGRRCCSRPNGTAAWRGSWSATSRR